MNPNKGVRQKTALRLKEAKERLDAFEAQTRLQSEPIGAKKSIIVWSIVALVGIAIYYLASWFSSR